MGLCEGRAVVAGDMAVVQPPRETGGGGLRHALAAHRLEAGAQGDHIGPMPLRATGVERPAPLLIDPQSQGALAKISTLLGVFPPLGKTGAAVEGREAGGGVGGIVPQERCAQGEALVQPAQQLTLQRSAVLRRTEVHRIPAAWAAQRVRASGHQPGEHGALVPGGASPLALGPRGTVDGCQDPGVPYRQGSPPPWGSGSTSPT